MRLIGRLFLLCLAVVLVLTSAVYAQESESLGDVARQARDSKQAKDAKSQGPSAKDSENQSVPSKRSKVITNEEIPEHPEEFPSPSESSHSSEAGVSVASGGAKPSAEQWKS